MSKVVEYILSLKDRLSAGLASADAKARILDSTMGNLGNSIQRAFAAASVTALGYKIGQAGMQVENARVGLTTLLKSADEAGRVISNTMEDATKTPFDFSTLLQGQKLLISASIGADRAREDMLNLANAIAATGGGNDELQRMTVNLQQIANTGEATAMDIKQFAYAGVNLYALLEKAGTKVDKNNQDQVISYSAITDALRKAHEEGGLYAGGLEAMAGTTSVQVSNLADKAYNLAVTMFNDLKPAIDSVITGLSNAIDYLRQGWEWLKRNRDAVVTTAKVVGGLWLAYKSLMGLREVITVVRSFSLAMSMSLGPIGLVISAIGALAAAVGIYSSSMDDALRTQNEMLRAQNDSRIDAFKQTYATDFQSSGLTMAEFQKREKGKIDEQMKEINSTTEKRLRENMLVSGKITNNAPGLQDLLFKKTALDQLTSTSLYDRNAVPKGADSASAKGKKLRGESKAVGSKNVTINVQVDNLIKESKVYVSNVKEGASRIHDVVVQALTGALNDFQVTAD